MKQQCPDREPGRDMPYGGIVNPRPETNALIAQMAAIPKPKTKTKTKTKERTKREQERSKHGARLLQAEPIALPFSAFMILSEKSASFS